VKIKTLRFDYDKEDTTRLDKFLVDCLVDISRSKIQKLILEGFVLVDGFPVNKNGLKIVQGQSINIDLPEEGDQPLEAEDIPLDVIYIDENAIVINKPAGMVVHPGAGNDSGTVVNAALGKWPELNSVGDPERPGVVHRLDKETSGVLLLARNPKAYGWFVSQFKQRKTKKAYLALVDGHPPTPEGRIEAGLHRDPKHRQRMAVALMGQGRSAITEYFRIKQFEDHDYLEVHPLSGRTHQIRVHLAYIGCPIVGDTLYGRKKSSLPLGRFFLHAQRLSICLPGEKQLTTFKSNLANDLFTQLSQLGEQQRVDL